jgi:hypothetical protein
MALPKIDLPIYELELPSTGKKVKYRPFTVKEEKILLTAQESSDVNQVILSIKQIINNCMIDSDVSDFALFDLEFVLINLRSKSVDNKISFEIQDSDTKETIKLEVDLTDIKVHRDPKHTNKIKVDDKYTLFLKYPSIDSFTGMLNGETITSEQSFEMLISCIDQLVSEDEVFKFKDFTKKEIDDFVESLESEVIKKMKYFFDTIPKVRHEVKYKNSEGKEKIYAIEGIKSFFI